MISVSIEIIEAKTIVGRGPPKSRRAVWSHMASET